MDFCLLKGGAVSFLEAGLNGVFPSGGASLWVKLYTNTVSLVNTLEASDFTEVIAESGYAAKELTGLWDIIWEYYIPQSIPAAYCAQQSFDFSDALSGGLTIKGYIVTDADGVALWAYELEVPFSPNVGLSLLVDPKVSISKANINLGSIRMFDAGAKMLLEARLNTLISYDLTLTVFGDSTISGTPFMGDYETTSERETVYAEGNAIEFSLVAGDWVVSADAIAEHPSLTQSFTGPITTPAGGYISGYYITSPADSVLLFGYIFQDGYQPDNGDTLYLNPTISLVDGTPT